MLSKISKTATIVLLVVCLLFPIVVGTLGIVAYSKTGTYPAPESLISALKGGEIRYRCQDSIDYMCGGVFGTIEAIMMLVCFIAACANTMIRDSFSRGLVPMITFGGLFGGLYILYKIGFEPGSSNLSSGIMAGTLILALVIIFFCLHRTSGGLVVIVSLIQLAVQLIVMPIVLWFASLSTYGKIGAVIALIVFIVLMTSKGGQTVISNISDEVPSSTEDYRKAKEQRKIQSEIDRLNRKIKAGENGLKNPGFHVDKKATARAIADQKGELAFWEAKLNK
ncbi:MAG: hypothetical protein J6U54_04275 [Clostridiales bacterium]|nr:hypothetical protein [Clostridiales bacterium]